MKLKLKIPIFSVFLLLLLVTPVLAEAKQFGGKMGVFIPPTPFPACPGHYIAYNSSGKGVNKIIGLIIVPGATKIYDYGNLFVPGVNILGKYSSMSFTFCVLPYKLVFVNEIGTSLTP